MRFDIYFTRGPLDGLTLVGDDAEPVAFASECFRRTGNGSVSARLKRSIRAC